MNGVEFDIRIVTGGSEDVIDKITGGFGAATEKANVFTSSLNKIGDAAFRLNNIRGAISGVADDFNKAVEPGIAFNDALKDLQALTGATDEQVTKIGASAREQSVAFGVDAARGLQSYKYILSQLGPELAKTPEALKQMGLNAATLSKQMGGDVGAATEVLTTAMNQYSVGIKNPVEATKTMSAMMNIMSASAREGSAELPRIKAALEQSGMMAKIANVSFAELNAAIQVLDKSGKRGAEGGVALRNAFAIMGEGPLMHRKAFKVLQDAGVDINALGDRTKTFEERLGYLKPVMNSVAAMTAIFGRENVAAGVALVQHSSALGEFKAKIVGTNAAQEIAAIKMQSTAEKMKVWQARIDEVKIGFYNAVGGMTPFVQMGMSALGVLANLAMASQLFGRIGIMSAVRGLGTMIVSLGSWIATTTMATLAQWGLNAAMYANPIGIIIAAIIVVIGVIVLLVKHWDWIWDKIKAFGIWVWNHHPFKFLIDIVDRIFPGFKAAMGRLWDWVVGKFEALIEWFKKAWSWIKGLFGAGKDGASDAAKSAVDEYAKQIQSAVIPGVTVQGTAPTDNLKLHPLHRGEGDGEGDGLSRMHSNITGGGPKNVTLNIQKLVEQVIIKTTNLSMGAKQAADEVVEALLMSLNSVSGKVVNE